MFAGGFGISGVLISISIPLSRELSSTSCRADSGRCCWPSRGNKGAELSNVKGLEPVPLEGEALSRRSGGGRCCNSADVIPIRDTFLARRGTVRGSAS